MLYRTTATHSVWRQLRRGSRSWRLQDRHIVNACHAHDEKVKWMPVGDLDANLQNFVVVDTINKSQIGDKRPANKLMTEFMRHFTAKLPCISIKTGMSSRSDLTLAGAAGLGTAVDAAKSGSPVIFLDTRVRPPPIFALQQDSPKKQVTQDS